MSLLSEWLPQDSVVMRGFSVSNRRVELGILKVSPCNAHVVRWALFNLPLVQEEFLLRISHCFLSRICLLMFLSWAVTLALLGYKGTFNNCLVFCLVLSENQGLAKTQILFFKRVGSKLILNFYSHVYFWKNDWLLLQRHGASSLLLRFWADIGRDLVGRGQCFTPSSVVGAQLKSLVEKRLPLLAPNNTLQIHVILRFP